MGSFLKSGALPATATTRPNAAGNSPVAGGSAKATSSRPNENRTGGRGAGGGESPAGSEHTKQSAAEQGASGVQSHGVSEARPGSSSRRSSSHDQLDAMRATPSAYPKEATDSGSGLHQMTASMRPKAEAHQARGSFSSGTSTSQRPSLRRGSSSASSVPAFFDAEEYLGGAGRPEAGSDAGTQQGPRGESQAFRAALSAAGGEGAENDGGSLRSAPSEASFVPSQARRGMEHNLPLATAHQQPVPVAASKSQFGSFKKILFGDTPQQGFIRGMMLGAVICLGIAVLTANPVVAAIGVGLALSAFGMFMMDDSSPVKAAKAPPAAAPVPAGGANGPPSYDGDVGDGWAGEKKASLGEALALRDGLDQADQLKAPAPSLGSVGLDLSGLSAEQLEALQTARAHEASLHSARHEAEARSTALATGQGLEARRPWPKAQNT